MISRQAILMALIHLLIKLLYVYCIAINVEKRLRVTMCCYLVVSSASFLARL
jgi:hypothetical protein